MEKSGGPAPANGEKKPEGNTSAGSYHRFDVPMLVIWVAVVFIVVFLAFGLFVWPTPWRYFTWRVGTTEIPMRSHRITDATQRLTLEGWVGQTPGALPPAELRPESVSPSVLASRAAPSPITQAGVEVQKNFYNAGMLYVDVYNGSSEEIEGLELEVSRTDGGPARLYTVGVSSLSPKHSRSVKFETGLSGSQIGEIRLVSVQAASSP